MRLEALGVDLAAIAAEATQVQPAEPAASLVPIGVMHEQALSLIAVHSYRSARPVPA